MVKYFFKKAIDGILPDSIIYRPKQGFRTPVVELFRGPLGDWGRAALLDGGLTRTGLPAPRRAGRSCCASTAPAATPSTTATGCGRC